jgi:uncharacterized protein
MKIGVISDTHDNIKNIKKAIACFNEKKVELIIHCGDWTLPSTAKLFSNLECEIISVFGNCDKNHDEFIINKKNQNWNIKFLGKVGEIEFDNRKIAFVHGDFEPVLNTLIASEKYDAVFSGHTHRHLIEKVGKTLHVNPGCCSGKILIQKVEPSIAIYETRNNTAEIKKI